MAADWMDILALSSAGKILKKFHNPPINPNGLSQFYPMSLWSHFPLSLGNFPASLLHGSWCLECPPWNGQISSMESIAFGTPPIASA
jgi:hypothetical protein